MPQPPREPDRLSALLQGGGRIVEVCRESVDELAGARLLLQPLPLCSRPVQYSPRSGLSSARPKQFERGEGLASPEGLPLLRPDTVGYHEQATSWISARGRGGEPMTAMISKRAKRTLRRFNSEQDRSEPGRRSR